ncbi:recombination-associated protein RdgC [Neptunicella marina]|uniref:Recombination-associated protein RdgC n=1 Tax=Neptunicella marina TaxID=2125989 RepID=A0A8J6ISW5_9ALTE|nr:recombination-associated protein RdgC [Neptunicella marina]MBC3764833.1 recombination-associated protein RdgC [Neptunicella marina]
MWFKNLKFYRITSPLELDEDKLQDDLKEFGFRPCGSQEQATQGWTSPFSKGDALFHSAGNNIWLNLKKQERLLPSSVVNAQLAEKVATIEADTGAAVGKKAKQDLKQEIIHQLLPKAFTKDSFTQGFISVANNLVVVDAGSDGKAEFFLAHLRKAIGSLPVVPLARRSLSAEFTAWLTEGNVPSAFSILEEAELRLPQDEGGIVRCKNQDLTSDEIQSHLDAGKVVMKIAVEWDETLSAILQEDLTVKRLKFTDMIREKNDDIPKEEQLAKMDADFSLMAGEVVRLANSLTELFELDEEQRF